MLQTLLLNVSIADLILKMWHNEHMIAHVFGEVVEKTENAVIVDVGGLGYEVQVAASDFEAATLAEKVKFYTHDHLRENAHELFGFTSLIAKRLFEMLISVSGVGPKMALAILGLGEVEAIRSAIALGDAAFVQRASGVGKRIAERVVVDLKDKVGAPGAMPSVAASVTAVIRDDALDALLALGFSLQDAEQALGGIDTSLSTQERVRAALKSRV
jgi:Holliday junction DNA helicase RuvA